MEIPSRNEVILRGTVVSMNLSGKLSDIRIVCESGRNKFFPQIMVHDNQLLNGIKIGQHILVLGHTQNHKVYYESTNKSTSTTQIVATQIKPACRALYDYFQNIPLADYYKGGQADDMNVILISGEVLGKYEINKKYLKIKVSAEYEKGKKTQCDITLTQNQAFEAKKNVSVGDTLVAVCYVQTSIKNDGKNDKPRISYQNIYCKDFEIFKKAN